MSDPFQLINAKTTPLCNDTCVGTVRQINCLQSTKTNSTTVTSPATTATTLCADKIKIKGFTSLESSGNTPTTVTSSVLAKTTSDDTYIELSSSVNVGCTLYVVHESGSDDVVVSGLVNSDTVNILPGNFTCFIKSTNGWVPGQFISFG